MQPIDYLIEASDRCVRIANDGRRLVTELEAVIGPDAKEPYSEISAKGKGLADELESLGREILAKAVEFETERQKSRPGTFGP